MAEYLSKYTGNRVDSAVGIIPSGKPTEDSVIVVGSTGASSYKPLSQIGGGDVTQSDLNLLGAKINENIYKRPQYMYLEVVGTNLGGASFVGQAISIDWGDGSTELSNTHTYTDGISRHIVKVLFDQSVSTKLRTHALENTTNIQNIYFPNTLYDIENQAFYQCNFEKIVFQGNKIRTIEIAAFDGCNKLNDINFPASLTEIQDRAFQSCTSLKKVTFNSTTPPTLGANAFPDTIEKIIVPKSAVSAYKAATGWSTYADKIVYEVDSSDLSSGGKTYRHLLTCSNYGNKITYKIVVYSSKSDAITTDYVLANPTCLIGAISIALDNEQGTNSFDRLITGTSSGPAGYFGIEAGGIVPPIEMVKIDSDSFAAI